MAQNGIRKIDLSVVIVSYNTRELTAQCVASILALDPSLAIEIIVVDNASNDGSARFLTENFRGVDVVEAGANHGFSHANNIGIARSRGEFILCLNPDTLVDHTAIANGMACLRGNRDVAMVGVRLTNAAGVEETSAMRCLRPHHFMLLALLPRSLVQVLPVVGDTRYGSKPLAASYDCDAIVGCFMLFPRWLIDRVGGFDDRFFMYGEEVEWCHRIRRAGYRVRYLGEHAILHYGGASTDHIPSWKLCAMARGQLLTQAIVHGPAAARFTNFWMIIGQLLRLPVWIGIAVAGRRDPLAHNWSKLRFLIRALSAPVSALYRDAGR